MGIVGDGRHYRAVSERLASESQRLSGAIPDVLYHYTGAEGLLGIVRDRGIFLTDSRFLNDASENTFGRRAFIAGLQRFLAHEADPKRREVVEFAIERITNRLAGTPPEHSGPGHFYVASFCQDGNLLSQWRAYGGSQSAGCSIGFASKRLVGGHRFPGQAPAVSFPAVYLQKVLYEIDVQTDFIDSAIRACFELSPTSDSLFYLRLRLAEDVPNIISPQIKAPVFKSEQEWRLVCLHGHDVRVRSGPRGLVPYMLCTYPDTHEPFGVNLPIVEICQGPSERASLHATAVGELLRINRMKHVRVGLSEIPLRD